MTIKNNFWILTGDTENWKIAIRDKLWGLRDKIALKKRWDKLQIGDYLFFYVKSPISGIIGFGEVKSKIIQDKPIWVDEIKENKVIYPYRFEIDIEYCIPINLWKNNNVSIKDLRLNFWAGINPQKNEEEIKKLIYRIDEKWNTNLSSKTIEEVKEKRAKEYKYKSLHDKIKDFIFEIGKIEKYICDKEYDMDSQRLDVVWRRVEKSVPNFAFEVQIGGNLYQALAKLKHAYDLWNSNIFIVIKEKDKGKVKALLSGTFHEIERIIKIIEVRNIEKLYDLEGKSRELRKKIGLI